VNSRSTTLTRGKYLAAILVLIIVAIGLLSGCTRTVTVTAKYRSLAGWYWICTGAQPFPCTKATQWHVSKDAYDHARVGQRYTLHIG
jgi:hypothetical protein